MGSMAGRHAALVLRAGPRGDPRGPLRQLLPLSPGAPAGAGGAGARLEPADGGAGALYPVPGADRPAAVDPPRAALLPAGLPAADARRHRQPAGMVAEPPLLARRGGGRRY